MSGYHETRLGHDDRRQTLWKTLCDSYFAKFIASHATVLELGCGYGEFINNVRCAERIAIDIWPGAAPYLAPEIRFQASSITDLGGIADHSIDFIFASNVFEHLSREDFLACLKEVRRVLRRDGTINILQPNYRFCYDEYFDDYTHVAIYSDRSLCDLLSASGFSILDCQPKFLPLSIKSRLPVSPTLIRAYLLSPIKFLGKQMLVRAKLSELLPQDGKTS